MLPSHWNYVRPARALVVICAFVFSIISCSDQNGTGLSGSDKPRGLTFAPHFVVIGGAAQNAAPVVNIRLTARRASNREVIGSSTIPVDPNADEWDLGFDVPGNAGTVVVLIELLNADNGIEWSGETGPIEVEAGGRSTPTTPVTLFQGPPTNLQVTGLVVTPPQSTVQEGAAVQLNAGIQPANLPATVFWTSLDAAIATVDNTGRVTTLRDGTARIVAHAGPRADTAVITSTQRPALIAVTPDTVRVNTLGAEFTMAARVLDPRGAEIPGAAVQWSSAAPNLVSHLGENRFRALGNGVAPLTARLGDLQGAGVAVVAQRVGRVTVTPGTASVTSLGSTQAFAASLADAGGSAMTGAVVWRSSNPAVATIDANGVARGVGVGNVEVTATANDGTPDAVVGRASFAVSQAIAAIRVEPTPLTFSAIGDSARVTAAAFDANNNAIPNVAFTWQSANPAIATVVNGLVRAAGTGTTQIIAQSGAVQGSATANVSQTVATLTVTPPTHTFSALGQTIQLSAVARDRNGTVVPGRATWQSSNNAVVTVDSLGLARSVGSGAATITASRGTVSATSQITVNVVVQNVTVNPPLVNLTAIGDTARITAAAFGDGGVPITDATFTWESSDTTIATVVNGLVRSHRTGNAVIVARVGNAAASASVVVTQTVASVVISPDSATLTSPNQSVTLAAQVRDRNGVLIPNARPVYTTSNPAAATVDSLGIVRPVENGYARITGSLNGVTDTVGIVVLFPNTTRPNLIVTDASIDSGILDDGQSYVVNIQLTNVGDAAGVVGTLRMRILNATTGAAMIVHEELHEPIAVGATSVPAVRFTIDTTQVWPDSIHIEVTVDALNVNAESDETDNTFVSSPYYLRFPVRSVVLTPSSAIMTNLTDSIPMSATAYDRRGVERANNITIRVALDSLQTGEASSLVYRNGWLVSRGAVAAALIEARSSDGLFRDTSYVQVRPVPVLVDISGNIFEPEVGDTFNVSGYVLGQQQQILPYPIVWSTPDPTIFTVNAQGQVAVIGSGTGRIVGSVFGHWGVRADTLTVTIPARPNLRAVRIEQYPGGAPTDTRASYAITIRNTGGAAAAGNAVRVSMLNPATGALLATREFGMNSLAAGDSIVIAVQLDYQATQAWPDSIRAHLAVDVNNVIAESDETDNAVAGPLQRVSFPATQLVVTPLDTTLTALGDSVQLVARSLDRFGREVPDSFAYRIVLDSAFAPPPPTVDVRANGWVVARSSTPAVIIEVRSLTPGLIGVIDSATVRVRPSGAVSLVVPEQMALYANDRQQIPAYALDATGAPVQVQMTWASRNSQIVSVDASGMAQAMLLNDSAYVVVTAGNLVDSVNVFVVMPENGTSLWLGHTSEWNDPANWSPGVVPNGEQSAYLLLVAAGRVMPTLTSNVDVRNLIVGSGYEFQLGAFNVVVSGYALAQGSISGTGSVVMTGAQGQIAGTFSNVEIGGAINNNTGSVTVNGDMRILSGSYTPSTDWATTVNGNLYRTGGELVMVGNRPYVIVRGDFISEGGDSRGRLSAGILEVHGDFTVRGAIGAAFAPTFNHIVYFSGTQPQTVSFTQTGQGSDVQYLNIIAVFNPAGVTFTHTFSPNLRIAGIAEVLNGGRMIVPQETFLDTYSIFYVRRDSRVENSGRVVIPSRTQWVVESELGAVWAGTTPEFRQ